jgi:Flp pilus assembly protein TadG
MRLYKHTANKKDRGQSMVEFALLLPFLILLIVGTFDLGRAFFSLITITNAAREGARYGTLHPSDEAGMKAAAATEATNSGIPITTSNVVVNCTKDVNGRCFRGGVLRVTVNYTFESLLNLFIPAQINISRFVEMAVQ